MLIISSDDIESNNNYLKWLFATFDAGWQHIENMKSYTFVDFLAHLARRAKWAFSITWRPSSVVRRRRLSSVVVVCRRR